MSLPLLLHDPADALLQYVEDWSEGCTRGETPLHKVASRNTEAVLLLLLENGVDVGPKTGTGSTPLHDAAAKRGQAQVRLLLEPWRGGGLLQTTLARRHFI